jgi:hypothetical protein
MYRKLQYVDLTPRVLQGLGAVYRESIRRYSRCKYLFLYPRRLGLFRTVFLESQ